MGLDFLELVERRLFQGKTKLQSCDHLAELGKQNSQIVEGLTALECPDEELREHILYVLTLIGPPARSAIPMIVAVLQSSEGNRDVQTQAGVALRSIGGEAVPVFAQLCSHFDAHVRFTAACELAELVDHWDVVTIQALIALLADEEAHVCDRAQRTLAKLEKQRCLPMLVDQLASADVRARIGTAHVLLNLEPSHPLALEVAVAGLRHEASEVRVKSCKALAAARDADHHVMTALAWSLRQDSDATVRAEAAYVIRELSAYAACIARDLGEALEDPNSEVRQWSALALMELGPDAEPATEFLVRALAKRVEVPRNVDADDETGSYLVNLVRTLGEIGTPAKAAVPHVKRAATDPMVEWKPKFGPLVEWALERCQG